MLARMRRIGTATVAVLGLACGARDRTAATDTGEPSRSAAPASSSAPGAPAAPASVFVDLSDGEGGIGFDDLRFSPTLGRVLAPAGRTGRLDLVDPGTKTVTFVPGFGGSGRYRGGHGEGTTSVDEGEGFLFAIDRRERRVDVIDPRALAIVRWAPLAGSPDYVRFVAPTRELWVTEPDAEQIEVFRLGAGEQP